MMYSVKGKWALITGAARGIGRLSALFLAEHGCNLILHSRDLSHTESLLSQVRAMGVSAFSEAADLDDPAVVQQHDAVRHVDGFLLVMRHVDESRAELLLQTF